MTTFYISTEFERNWDFSKVLDFVVKAEISSDDQVNREVVGSLRGFFLKNIFDLDSLNFDYFDARSGHTAEGYEILSKYQRELCISLQIEHDELEMVESIIFCEKILIAREYRKKKLALRLLREPMYAFSNAMSLMILKAHPDGKGVTDNDCRKLADYYSQDQALQFRNLDKDNLAGWLVSKGAWNAQQTEDNHYFDAE